MKMVSVQQVVFNFFLAKKMGFRLNINLLKKENEEHEKIFKDFHRCIYRKVTKETFKMSIEILLDHGKLPTDHNFEEKCYDLIKTILEKKLISWVVI